MWIFGKVSYCSAINGRDLAVCWIFGDWISCGSFRNANKIIWLYFIFLFIFVVIFIPIFPVLEILISISKAWIFNLGYLYHFILKLLTGIERIRRRFMVFYLFLCWILEVGDSSTGILSCVVVFRIIFWGFCIWIPVFFIFIGGRVIKI